jgi:hypothetical protein
VRRLIEKDGGLEKLYDRAKKEIPLRKGGGKKPDEQEWNDDDLTGEGRKQVNDDDVKGPQDEPKSDEGFKDRGRRQRLTLEIEISPERLDRVFGMSRGQEGILRFKALGEEGHWHRFRATRVKMPAGRRTRKEPSHLASARSGSAKRVHALRLVAPLGRSSTFPPRRRQRR